MLFQLLNKMYWRFIAPSPLLFRIVNWILNITLFIGAIQQIVSMFGIVFHSPYDILTSKIFFISGGIGRLICGMTVKPQQNEKNI